MSLRHSILLSKMRAKKSELTERSQTARSSIEHSIHSAAIPKRATDSLKTRKAKC
jgi:hypothetical protein